MKILIAYDGSHFAEAAIDDLKRAGLPVEGSARVVSVAPVWLPPPESMVESSDGETSEYIREIIDKHRRSGEKAVASASLLAKYAADRVRTALPGWKVDFGATYGSPGWSIIDESETFGADLVVVGSNGDSFVTRLMLGSISQRVLNDAVCSVRIARGKVEVEPGPERIIIGFDGSKGSQAAVEAVSRRNWHPQAEIRLVTVTEPVVPTTIGRFVTPVRNVVREINQEELELLERMAEGSVALLTNSGLKVNLHVLPGNPKQVMIDEAESWGADCIFMGATSWASKIERVVIGSTSSAVASRAHCSVEVVRKRPATASELPASNRNLN